MLTENVIVYEEEVEKCGNAVFENGFCFSPVSVVQIVDVHEIHVFFPLI